MYKLFSKTMLVILATAISGSVFANVTDSTSIGKGDVKPKPVSTPFLLAQGSSKVGDGHGRTNADIYTTSKRCPINSYPSLNTSVKSIQRWGQYGLLGINNSLYLNSGNYRIYGKVDAPVGGFINANYVVVNWQVWCMV